MDLSKFLMFFVILTLAVESKAVNARINDQTYLGESHSVDSECLCLPKTEGNQPVLHFIDADRNRFERLVVYFYIDPDTKKATAYTPKAEKQKIFPELSLDIGDILASIESTENIGKLILSPNKLTANVIAQLNPSINLKIDDGINNAIPNIPTDINIIKNSYYKIPQNLLDSINALNVPNNNNADWSVNDEIKILDNINLETPKQIKPNKRLQNDRQITYNVRDEWKTNNIYDWEENVNYIYGKPSSKPININELGFKNFDQWFQQQKDSSISKFAQNDVKFPDDSFLKSLIYKNLVSNGILMMDNGILRTPEGNILNLSNLKLQPLVVGLSMDHNYPGSGVQSNNVPPYYDAMVLSMNDPQKILGVIPIGLDYRTNYPPMKINNVIPGAVSSPMLKTQCSKGKCYTVLDKEFSSAFEEQVSIGNYPRNDELLLKLDGGLNTIQNPQDLYATNQIGTLYGNSQPHPGYDDLLSQLFNILSDESRRTGGKKAPKPQIPPVAEDNPEFRIIGGSAATGSGTPLSSKGRSAI